MVEYTALMIGALGLMFFMLDLSFRLQDGAIIEDGGLFTLMDFIKVAILFCGFVLGLFVVWFMMTISFENGASAGLQNVSTTLFWFWGIILLLVMVGLALYWLWWIPNVIKKADKATRKRNEDNE